jgi:hypothetical protein
LNGWSGTGQPAPRCFAYTAALVRQVPHAVHESQASAGAGLAAGRDGACRPPRPATTGGQTGR